MIIHRHLTFSGVGADFIQFPDLPGWVVQILRVSWQAVSFSAEAGVALNLNHNVANNVIPINDFASTWCRLNIASGGNRDVFQDFSAEPLDLIGLQSAHFTISAGTLDSTLAIIYRLRRESNRTLWNAIRRRTSFEKD